MASSERPWQGAGVGHQALPDDEIADDDQDGAEGDVGENEQQVHALADELSSVIKNEIGVTNTGA